MLLLLFYEKIILLSFLLFIFAIIYLMIQRDNESKTFIGGIIYNHIFQSRCPSDSKKYKASTSDKRLACNVSFQLRSKSCHYENISSILHSHLKLGLIYFFCWRTVRPLLVEILFIVIFQCLCEYADSICEWRIITIDY